MESLINDHQYPGSIHSIIIVFGWTSWSANCWEISSDSLAARLWLEFCTNGWCVVNTIFSLAPFFHLNVSRGCSGTVWKLLFSQTGSVISLCGLWSGSKQEYHQHHHLHHHHHHHHHHHYLQPLSVSQQASQPVSKEVSKFIWTIKVQKKYMTELRLIIQSYFD